MIRDKKAFSARLTKEKIDKIFENFVSILTKNIKAIYRVKDLQWQKGALMGLLYGRIIYLRDGMSDTNLAKTLVHELIHFFLDTSHEKTVRRITDLLWRRFSKQQKAILRAFIPNQPVLEIPPVHC